MNPIEIIEILVIVILIPIAISLWLSFILAVISVMQGYKGMSKIHFDITKIEDEEDEIK